MAMMIEHLGQTLLANTDTRICCVPAGEYWTLTAIHALNTVAAGRNLTMRHRRSGDGTANGQLLVSGRLVAASTEERISALHGLGPGDELSGLGNAANAFAVNVYGVRAKLVEHLAQINLTNSEGRILCVPPGEHWTIWHITCCNITASSRTLTLRHRRAGEANSNAQLHQSGRSIAANAEERYTTVFGMHAGDELTGQASSVTALAVNVYGTRERISG